MKKEPEARSFRFFCLPGCFRAFSQHPDIPAGIRPAPEVVAFAAHHVRVEAAIRRSSLAMMSFHFRPGPIIAQAASIQAETSASSSCGVRRMR